MAAGPSNPNVLQAPRPVDVPKAQDAIHQVQAIGAGINKPVRLVDVRRTPVADLLRPADPANKVEPGILQASTDPNKRWKDDAPTRDFLENARAHAAAEAKRGLAEFIDPAKLGLKAEDIPKMTLDQLKAAAKAKGWTVEATPGDAALVAKAQETVDYLENALEYAKEQAANQPGAVTGGEVAVDPALAKANLSGLSAEARGDLLGILAGGPAQQLIEDRMYAIDQAVQQSGKEATKAQQKEYARLVKLKKQLQDRAGAADKELIRLIGPENTTPEQQALGYDMQRRLYDAQLISQNDEMKALQASGKGSGPEARALAKKIESTEDKIKTAERSKKALVDGGGTDANGNKIAPHPELAGDLVVQYATEMSQSIQGATPLTAEETATIAKDPIAAIQAQLSKAAEDPAHMQKLVDSHMVTAAQAEDLVESMKMTDAEREMIKKDASKEKQDQTKQVSMQILACLGLFAYAAYQKKKGASQG